MTESKTTKWQPLTEEMIEACKKLDKRLSTRDVMVIYQCLQKAAQ